MSAQQAAHHDRAAAHGAGIVEQERDDGIAEGGVALHLERKRLEPVGDDAGQPRRVQEALVEIEIPGAVLLRQQAALQAVREPAYRDMQHRKLLVEKAAEPFQFIDIAQGFRRLRIHRTGA